MTAGPILLTINHVEMLDDNGMEWDMQTEEVLGGPGRATITVQDRTNVWEPQAHWDVKAVIRSSGWVLFRGEIINEPLELPVGMPFRRWKLDCADYNNEFDQRLVGVEDGVTWQDIDGLGDYVNVDPYAHSLDTDKLTIQQLLDHYIRVDGEAFETTSFVGEYLQGFFPIFWSFAKLQGALEELAQNIAENLQFWADPDLKFHWVTIPAWQDLASQMAALAADPTKSHLPALFPESALQGFALAPANISDIPGLGTVGGRQLKATFDGAAMPEQIYVRGGTGYVYNAPAIDPVGGSVAVNPRKDPKAKGSDKFRLTFLATTRLYSKLSSGYINPTYTTVAASGPYDVRYVKVPVNNTTHLGGGYWKLLSGPNVGKLVDNDTNYFGYGSIKVVKLVPATTPPSVGIGGSGWTKEDTQDPNKRQAFLDAPISTDQAKRDSLGGQALYRGSRPTLRGSVKVSGGTDSDGITHGPDGWRAGQLSKFTDERLPLSLNDKYFLIQRVQTNLIEFQDVREYILDWGDGPTSRYTAQPRGGGDGGFPNPATQVLISVFDLSPGPNSTQTVIGQLADRSGAPWKIAGKVVKWTLEAYTAAGSLIEGQGSLTPEASATDSNGRARTKLLTGPMTGLVYFIFADVTV